MSYNELVTAPAPTPTALDTENSNQKLFKKVDVSGKYYDNV